MRIAIAGGGTGGHIFPGLAIADAFIAKNPKNKILFIGAGKSLEVSVLSKSDFQYEIISVRAIKGQGLWKQALSVLKIPVAIINSIRIFIKFKPDVVIGLGGYSSGPALVGAWLMGIKTAIHEQNVLLGVTNRILSHLVNKIFVSFSKTKTKLNSKKVIFTGNPVRKEILQCAKNQKRQHKLPLTILITGGSQGAHSINLSVIESLQYIIKKENFFFIHQTGTNDEKIVKRAYLSHGISCLVKSFFTDMAQQLQKADLIVCRAGATTVAEIAVMGKSAIFIPFPFASDNHQVLNTQELVNQGSAEMILQKNLTGKLLADKFNHYADNFTNMTLKFINCVQPNAADVIITNFENL